VGFLRAFAYARAVILKFGSFSAFLDKFTDGILQWRTHVLQMLK